MIFKPEHTDYDLSPFTGLTRESWIEAGVYLLTGMFNNIPDFDSPVVMPRKETEITYPHKNSTGGALKAEERAEIFEGLTRSFFIAAPLIHEQPGINICGFNVRDYYKSQVLRVCTKGDSIYVGDYEYLQEMTGHRDPGRAFQQTVETCALVICLWMCRDELWAAYGKEEKDVIAAFLSSFAHQNTVPQNWRLFNMLDMAFLHMEGYKIDREIMRDHAQAILNYYVGDGWYRDGQSFDYYSCWAFNVYAPLWNKWYGYENEPYIAKAFEKNSNRLMETYPDFFDRDGFTNMWGRSGIYRNAATSAFDANMFLNESKADPGLARRITSGSLLQFLTREDFLFKGVPTLGFYGQFSPLVQGYSCAGSPYWLGKAFLCLHLPADHPFWTAKENNGSWEKMQQDAASRKMQQKAASGKMQQDAGIKETVLDGPALCFTNHGRSGETILRTGKVVKNTDDIHGMWNYLKLSFNSKYPWEATPKCESGVCSDVVESQQYVLRDADNGELQRCNTMFWCGSRDGVLYRRQFFKYRLDTEEHWMQALNLADFALPYGIMRVDGLRLFKRPVELTLGAYGFPDNGTEITEREENGAKAIILKGSDFKGVPKQLAMTIYDGWDSISFVKSSNTNPDSEKSIIVYAKTKRIKQYGGYEKYLMISQVITKEDHEDFTDGELFPVRAIEYEDETCTGSYGNTIIHLKNGEDKCVCFEGIEGRLTL